MFTSFAIILTLAALFSYINYRWLKLPSTIGSMVLALVTSIVIIASSPVLPGIYAFFCSTLEEIDFSKFLFDFMLSFLLFAGAIHIDISDLEKEKTSVLLFATLGVGLSTAIIGFLLFGVSDLIGYELPLLHCIIFGALISPTDPIAVIAILKEAKVGKSLELKIEGESLFNDGVGVVVFTGILLLIEAQQNHSGQSVGLEVLALFCKEAIGGIIFGFILGYIGWKLIESISENRHLIVLLTFAIVMGGYSLASMIGVSGPLAMVVCGLIIGKKIHIPDFPHHSREILNSIWEILDDTFNAIFFVLIGLMIYQLDFHFSYLLLGFFGIFIVLLSRLVSLAASFSLLRHSDHHFFKTVGVLTWGGLRGGISVALALSLQEDISRDEILFITYTVVLFSIIIQGLTIGRVVKYLNLSAVTKST